MTQVPEMGFALIVTHSQVLRIWTEAETEWILEDTDCMTCGDVLESCEGTSLASVDKSHSILLPL